MALFGNKEQFCTQCGKKLEKKEIICSECQNIIDAKKVQRRDENAIAELKDFAGGTVHDRGKYKRLLNSYGIPVEYFKPIKANVKQDIIKYHIAPQSVKNRIIEYAIILNKIETLFDKDKIKSEIKNLDLSTQEELSFIYLAKKDFKQKALENPNISITYVEIELKSRINDKKEEIELEKQKEEKRKQKELEKQKLIEEKRTSLSLELDKKDLDDDFKQKVSQQIKEGPIFEYTEIDSVIEEVRVSEETLQNLIENTREFNVSIPYDKKNPGPLMGAITGDIIAGGAGRVIGGLAGAGDTLGMLGGAATGGLLLGGLGAVIGAVASAADDGIGWHDSKIILNESSMVFASKFSIPLNQIKHIESSHDKKYGEIVSLTLLNQGIIFKVDDSNLFKLVVEKLMNDLNEVETEKVKNLIEEKNSKESLSSEVDKADALLKYANLLEKGLITQEEFDAKKKEILSL